jgi:Tfp pilus assembly protein PilF
MQKNKKIKYLVAFIISFITILVYLPSLQNDFVNWDDGKYVYENPNIQHIGLKSIRWMFTTFHASNWHPLTWFSHAIDYAMWGLNPMGHHLTSIIFHGLNTFLVVILITNFVNFGRGNNLKSLPTKHKRASHTVSLVTGAIVGLLFGLHPLHVESVAWISERKDVLYAFLFLLSILSYLKYTSSSLLQRQRILYYSFCLLSFVLSLMSKPMAVTLPVVLIILDFYPLGRLDLKSAFTSKRKLLMEKVPFFGLSLASSVITIIAQQKGRALTSLEVIPFSDRILMAIRALVFYLYKIFWPAKLAPLYPYPAKISFFTLEYLLALAIVFIITAFSVYLWRKQRIWLAVWTFYLVTLLPVLGLIQVGRQSAADRYTYLVCLGPFLIIGSGVAKLAGKVFSKDLRLDFRKLFVFLLGPLILLILLSNLTINQIGIWKDSITLWKTVINIFPNKAFNAHENLGNAYIDQGRINDAIAQFQIAIRINPFDADVRYNLGVAYYKKGLVDKAIREYQIAKKINPYDSDIQYNLGLIYQSQGFIEKAIRQYKITIELNPYDATAYNNLGNAYKSQGRINEAIQQYEAAILVKPDLLEAHYNVAIAYKSKGLIDKANEHFRIARQLNPEMFK